MILGYPILRLAVKDIMRGMLTINELVAIAFSAAMASGESQLGGCRPLVSLPFLCSWVS